MYKNSSKANEEMFSLWDYKSNNSTHNALLNKALELAFNDLKAVNDLIQKRLESNIGLIRTLGAYIIKSRGKRLRPLILLLSAKACGYQGDDHIILAAVIEFIHTATLLHDDVIDASATRRGQPTANAVWGNEASILVGDFLYSRSFEMIVETNNIEVMKILAETTNAIAEGEIMQLLDIHSLETTEAAYMKTIRRKTAKLFESAAWLGGVISNQPATVCEALAKYGMHLGTAFQLIDDILDYNADSHEIGKDIGDDLSEGKPTLPLIYVIREGNSSQREIIKNAIKKGDRSRIQEVLSILKSTGAIAYTQKRAEAEAILAKEAINVLAEAEYKHALMHLAQFSVIRKH